VDAPIYGLQLPGLAERRPLPGSLTELAGIYISAIRSVRPAGPYRLLGWSLGGNLAQAVAAILQQDGEQVDLVALLDAFPAEQHTDLHPEAAREEIKEQILKTDALREHADTALEAILNAMHLLTRHTTSTYRGDVLHFAAKYGRTSGRDTAAEWQPYVDGTVEVHTIDCDHDGMGDPIPLDRIAETIATRPTTR
jgi:thioesterase domain-containing protein